LNVEKSKENLHYANGYFKLNHKELSTSSFRYRKSYKFDIGIVVKSNTVKQLKAKVRTQSFLKKSKIILSAKTFKTSEPCCGVKLKVINIRFPMQINLINLSFPPYFGKHHGLQQLR
jgi:hypothetical protein